jgi:ectoine hydroxylase-related dioxygenase (phytanoyl-CoA dioxygenase family)
MIDTELVERYQRDGAVCIRQIFGRDEIATLRAGIDLNLGALSPRAIVASAADDPGRFVEDFCNWQDNAHYRSFIFESALAETAGRLMRSSTARLYHDHMLTKEPGTRQATPWHQDQPYYNIMDAEAKWFPEGTLADLPNIDVAREKFPILGWDLQPGDAVCFHMLMLHGARGVTGAHRRRVFSVRFLGDDIRHTPRRWKTSPEFPGLAEELPAGAPMSHPLFPVLWCCSHE